jgi:hypothetical protein
MLLQFKRIPIPSFLGPRSVALAVQDEHGRYAFDVSVTLFNLPMVRYYGWLVPSDENGARK